VSTAKKFYLSRQRQTLPVTPESKDKPVVLNSNKSLKEYSDYLGPLLIYPVLYYFPVVYKLLGYEYGQDRVIHPVQTCAMYYWCFHYFKRIMETFFVHRFSHATSPIAVVFRSCAYYWTFAAYVVYDVKHPLYTPVSSDLRMKMCFGGGLVGQAVNFYCHILLRNLRDPIGSGGYQIPRGFLFNFITCANYTTEIYQWFNFTFATHTTAARVFLLVAIFIM
ncbi:unnamed protein product, partial [Brassica rapa]